MPPVEPASEVTKQIDVPFVPSTDGLPPPMDDNAVRAIFADAAAKGIDDLNATIQTQAPQGQPSPAPAPQSEIPKKEVPAKFQKPDGTVDEEKLKASTARIEEAVQEKQKTVDELLADYEARQKELGNLGNKQGQLKKQIESLPAAQPPQADVTGQSPDAIRAQLLQLAQTDPIAFAVEISRAVARKEALDIAAPALEVTQGLAEQQRIAATRANIAALAEQDPRILQGPLYEELKKELNNPSENYWALKNPHRAAWNEVKDRLRLGEAPKASVQPSNPSPILGRGSPATVQGLAQVQTPQTMYQQVTGVDPFSEEGKRLEEQLREASKAVWRA